MVSQRSPSILSHLTRRHWLLAGCFFLLTAVSVSYLVLRLAPESEAKVLEDWRSQLRAMADDREAGIERFISDLSSDVRTVSQYPTATYLLTERRGPPYPFDPAAGADVHLRELLDAFVREHGYRAALLYDTAGSVVSATTGAVAMGGAEGRLPVATSTMAADRPVVRLVPGPPPRLLAAAPARNDEGVVVGAIVLETDAEDFLFPLLRQQPTRTATGEALLVERAGDELVLLSPLRKAQYPTGGLRLSGEGSGLAAWAALTGSETVGWFEDYRGDAVLAATRHIDGTEWGLVVKVDREEALAGHRLALGRVVAAILGLLVGAVGVTFGLWRWQQSRFVAELVRERAQFAALLDHASDPILFIGMDQRVLEANRRAEEFYGYSREEMVGSHVRMFLPGGSGPEAGGETRGTFTRKETLVETEHVLADGTRVPVEISTRTAELDGRAVMISIVRDIRERKRAEEALRKTEERYRTIVENSPDVVARFGSDLRCLYVSPRRDGGFPFTASDPVGRRHSDLGLPSGVAHTLDAALREVFESGTQQEREVMLPDPDHARFFDWRFVPERDGRGQVVTAVAIIRETTAQHALETRLRQSQKMEAVGRLAGGVAHDFNNVLTSIQGHAELALDSLDGDDPLQRDLEEIVRSAKRAASLTRQLLAFSRRQILEPRIVDLGRVVTSMEPMLRRLIGEAIQMRVDVLTEAATIRADPSQVEQVILNLAVNARDAMPGGGRLRIRVDRVERGLGSPGEASGPAVRLVVSDTGEGIEPETLDHIFEPFFTTREPGKGTGLGLSTVYGIVEQSGGQVRVESQPGTGSRFAVTFPAVERPANAAAEDLPESAPRARGELVLLVEDEEGVRSLARRVLRRKGYRVVDACSGPEALAAAKGVSEPIDLLLTDMVMPGMDGRELARRIREDRPACRVLVMSGYTEDPAVRGRTLDPGSGFLEKPFSPDQLATAVAGVLAGPAPEPAG